MRFENDNDPRSVIARTKHFVMRPVPLERVIRKLGLTRTAEQVYWLHWDAGLKRGDWTSEIPISVVARDLGCNPSTVTRAYQLLIDKRLLRRHSAGRDPNNSFLELTRITEVLLPNDHYAALMNAPDRGRREITGAAGTVAPKVSEAARPPNPTPVKAIIEERYGAQGIRVVLAKLTPDEQEQWNRLWRECSTGRVGPFDFRPSENSKLDEPEVRYLIEVLDATATKYQAEKREQIRQRAAAASRHPSFRLSAIHLADLRDKLRRLLKGAQLEERFREITWSLEHGALRRFDVRHGLNIAIKKCRDGQWTRPNQMPPNWRCIYTAHGPCRDA